MQPLRATKELVLVGGGHTHVQVLRRLAMAPLPGLRITLVVDLPLAVYSGMVPGFVAGQYAASELEIDVVPLARRAGAAVVLARAVGIDPGARRLELEGRPPLRYDLCSFDIGSVVAGLDIPGVREHAVPTRPIGRFVTRVGAMLDSAAAAGQAELPIAVVGAGAGGVELAFTLEHRLRREGLRPAVRLLHAGTEILPGFPRGLAQRVRRLAAERGIEIHCDTRVSEVRSDTVRTDAGADFASALTVWVTGAVSQPLFENSGLRVDDRGFVLVENTLQLVDHPEIFAAGDCATLERHPALAKAGVYAVRAGPTLTHNLRAKLTGESLEAYRPQRDFLALLNLGGGLAVGSKLGVAIEGAWVMDLKDRIDRRFMRRFQVLDDAGALSAEFAQMPAMQMLCGGCAAKVGQSVLDRALKRLPPPRPDASVLLGLDKPDDAAAVRTPAGDTLVSSIDAFRAFTDDPWLVGRVAAVNAVSDLFAKGVRPRWALAIVALPESEDPDATEDQLYQLLAGARACLDPLGVTLLGGHTTTAPELVVGFNVEGVADPAQPLMDLSGLREGDRLLLGKALGTGVLLHADMQGRARGPWLEAAFAQMIRDNSDAATIAARHGALACTDITGFGLAGHLAEMLRQSGVSAELKVDALPAVAGAEPLMRRALRSTFHAENARARRGLAFSDAAAAHPRFELLFDPQTSGGLLFGVRPEARDAALEDLRQAGYIDAADIGLVTAPREDGAAFAVSAT